MLGVIDHPRLSNPEGFTTSIISWFDGGLHFFTPVPASSEDGFTVIGIYYSMWALVFVLGWLMLRHWIRKGSFRMRQRDMTDLFLLMVPAVLVGAKVVYVLFYNLEYYLEYPLQIVTNWSGMASHGAFLGVALLAWYWARSRRVSFLHLGDHAVMVAALAPIFVRFGNFMNAELYGRSTSPDLPWAMRFPMRDGLGRQLFCTGNGSVGDQVYALVTHLGGNELPPDQWHYVPHSATHAFETFGTSFTAPLPTATEGKSLMTTVYQAVTDASHPSQLYELVLSGLVLFAVMLVVRSRSKLTGTTSAVFVAGYGLSRILLEFFRQPDPQRTGGFFDVISMGQLLSLALVAGGLAIFWYSRRYPQPIDGLPIPAGPIHEEKAGEGHPTP